MGFPAGLRHKRRMLVGQLWMRGYSVRAIAELLQEQARKDPKLQRLETTTYVTVWKDVKECQAQWMERSLEKLDTKRAEQVARLEDVIHQAWLDFANCKTLLKTNNYDQRPRYLRVILDAEEKIAKISGTLAPLQVTGGEGEPIKVEHDYKSKLLSAVSRHTPEGGEGEGA